MRSGGNSLDNCRGRREREEGGDEDCVEVSIGKVHWLAEQWALVNQELWGGSEVVVEQMGGFRQ